MNEHAVLVGLPAAPGVVIGRAVRIASHRGPIPRHLLADDQVDAELARWSQARQAAIHELQCLQDELSGAPSEQTALLEVHLLLLQDEVADAAVRERIARHHYNAEWALQTHTEEVVHQFESAEDDYLRARQADLEQVGEHLLRALLVTRADTDVATSTPAQAFLADTDTPLIVVARDLSPVDLLQFRKTGFAGFVTDVGGSTGHTAIVARSMGIPAVVGTRSASATVQPDDVLVLDGDVGKIWVNPTPECIDRYRRKQKQSEQGRQLLARLKDRPAQTRDGTSIDLLANIEHPDDCALAVAAGAAGVGLFRTEFLFMGRGGDLPGEDEQFAAYRQAVQAMGDAPVTIRSVDIGADKPLHGVDGSHNPALGLRAIRWSLSEPAIFLTQLRAILRASAHGNVRLLIPMLAHASQVHQTLELVATARRQLQESGLRLPALPVGAMIEIPAAALQLPLFLRHFDFLSVGTNDLTQYTLAVDRTDETVAGLFDPLHPAVLRLVADTIAAGLAAGKEVTVCGEMAGDAQVTRLLLGLGLRSFSMHAAQILAVKREILQTRVAGALADWAERVVNSEDPAAALHAPA